MLVLRVLLDIMVYQDVQERKDHLESLEKQQISLT